MRHVRTLAASVYSRWCRESGLCSRPALGSSAGLAAIGSSKIDVAGSDAVPTTEQLAGMERASGGARPRCFPTLLAAVAIPTKRPRRRRAAQALRGRPRTHLRRRDHAVVGGRPRRRDRLRGPPRRHRGGLAPKASADALGTAVAPEPAGGGPGRPTPADLLLDTTESPTPGAYPNTLTTWIVAYGDHTAAGRDAGAVRSVLDDFYGAGNGERGRGCSGAWVAYAVVTEGAESRLQFWDEREADVLRPGTRARSVGLWDARGAVPLEARDPRDAPGVWARVREEPGDRNPARGHAAGACATLPRAGDGPHAPGPVRRDVTPP